MCGSAMVEFNAACVAVTAVPTGIPAAIVMDSPLKWLPSVTRALLRYKSCSPAPRGANTSVGWNSRRRLI